MNRQPLGVAPAGCYGSAYLSIPLPTLIPNRTMRRFLARKKEKASGNWPLPQPTKPQRKEGSQ
jgi:hypothetical protein